MEFQSRGFGVVALGALACAALGGFQGSTLRKVPDRALVDVTPRLDTAKKLTFFMSKLGPGTKKLSSADLGFSTLLTPKVPRISGRGAIAFSGCDFYWPDANFASFDGPKEGQQNGSHIQVWWAGAVVNKPVLVSFAMETMGPVQWRVGYGSRENSGADTGQQLITTTETKPIVSVVILPNKAGKFGANIGTQTPGSYVLRSIEITPLK